MSNPEPKPLPGIPTDVAKRPRPAARRQLKDKEQTLLAGKMAAERVLQGATVTQLADKYRVSAGMVYKLLDLAETKGLIDHHRAGIFEDLLPQAIAVYEVHLRAGNLEAARDIVQGLGVLNPKSVALTPNEGEETLEIYRLRRRLADQTADSPLLTAGSRRVVEGERVDQPERPALDGEGPDHDALSQGDGTPRPEDPSLQKA